ncbi:MAG: M20 family metallo-hydrolase [Candidatus Micrarchaeia archaeon]
MEIGKLVESYKQDMIQLMKDMIAIPSISPESGGSGESKRADFLEKYINSLGIKTRRFDYIDNTKAKRSNIIAKVGNAKKTIWLIAHIDTVAPGDLSLWSHDPFDAYVKDGKIFGRGTSDNGQGVVSSIFALKAVVESGIQLSHNIGIALVADEEVGSEYGIKRLLKEKIFSKHDMAIVPDWGTEDGSQIEIAEKGILWLKFDVKGKQVHASTPNLGTNAYRTSIKMLNELDSNLHKKYNSRDSIFNPPVSTFEMTKHEKNVDSVNIVPGSETFYMDCRVLPNYKLDSILKDVKSIAMKYSSSGSKVLFTVYNREDPAKPTSKNSELANMMAIAIKDVKNVEPKFVGIGGGTVAKYFRDLGMQAIVWATLPDNAHQPNEYCKIDDMVSDAKVFAQIFAKG